jgi:hypothetical protein
VLHPLALFTTKPKAKPMKWCTHFGSVMTTPNLILHPDKWVIVRSHICNDRLLIWKGLVHVWNRGLQDSLLLCDITIMGPQLILCLLYQNMSQIPHIVLCSISLYQEVCILSCVMYKFTISGLCSWAVLCTAIYHEVSISCCVMYTVTLSEGKHLELVSYTGTIPGDKHLELYLINSDYIRRWVSHAELCTKSLY